MEVVDMVGLSQQQHQRSSEDRRAFGDRALRWSWYLFLLSYPWHLVGGGIAYAITWLAGGDFSEGTGVPGFVYPALYIWMISPLVASVVLGVMGWVKGHRVAAIVPALASVAMIVVITTFGFEEFFG